MDARAPRSNTDPVRADDVQLSDMAVFSREIDTVRSAREWMLRFLRRHGQPTALCNDAELIVSELVTNALRHGLGDVVTRGSLAEAGCLQLSVTDSGPELPRLQPLDPDRIGGVGLRIVDELASSWGVAPFPGGKTVWATIEIGPDRST
jgi:anti-sigma regulatory factor (Ser/Thr protein kinase)